MRVFFWRGFEPFLTYFESTYPRSRIIRSIFSTGLIISRFVLFSSRCCILTNICSYAPCILSEITKFITDIAYASGFLKNRRKTVETVIILGNEAMSEVVNRDSFARCNFPPSMQPRVRLELLNGSPYSARFATMLAMHNRNGIESPLRIFVVIKRQLPACGSSMTTRRMILNRTIVQLPEIIIVTDVDVMLRTCI